MNPTIAQKWGNRDVSLARQMSEIMTEVTSLFGPRDERFLFIGWEFIGERPQIFFPSSGERHVLIRLSMKASEFWNTAIHELAHECVHLLSPVVGAANNLEEGVATWYADRFYRHTTSRDPGPISDRYRGAYDAVVELFARSPHGPETIRELRTAQSSFSQMDASLLLRIVPNLDPVLASFLVRQWDSSTPNRADGTIQT